MDPGMGGLMDYKARFYSPYLNHFIQPDSLIPDPTNSQAWNRFGYVLNNPINFKDPTGHEGVPGDGDTSNDCWQENEDGTYRYNIVGCFEMIFVVDETTFITEPVNLFGTQVEFVELAHFASSDDDDDGAEGTSSTNAAARITENSAKGKELEDLVAGKNNVKKKIDSHTATANYRYPDINDDQLIGEVKNKTTKQHLTGQLRDDLIEAEETGKTFVLFSNHDMKVSKPLQKLIDIGKIIWIKIIMPK